VAELVADAAAGKNGGKAKREWYGRKTSEHQRRTRAQLRLWERSAKLTSHQRYAARTLIGQLERKSCTPRLLPDFETEHDRRGRFLGLLVLCCLIRNAKGLEASKPELAAILKCSEKQAYLDLRLLVEKKWVVKHPGFKRHRSHGRAGEVLDHRQTSNWYEPGPLLRLAWQRHLERQRLSDQRFRRAGLAPKQAAGQGGSISAGNSYLASPSAQKARPYRASAAQQPRAGASRSEGPCGAEKVSPSATVEKERCARPTPPEASAAWLNAGGGPGRANQGGRALAERPTNAGRNCRIKIMSKSRSGIC
jgi:hypothetical protein